MEQQALEKITQQLNNRCGTKESTLTVTQGEVHEHLGMTIDYSVPGKVMFKMDDYVDHLLSDLPVRFYYLNLCFFLCYYYP